MLACESEEYIPDEAGEGIVGAGGTYVATFSSPMILPEGVGGMATITFTYARPWETGEEPADTRVLEVWVTEAGGLIIPEEEGDGFDVKTAVLERFLGYVVHDTQSALDSDTVPSTGKQIEFAKLLAEECERMGLGEVVLSDFGVVMATLPSNMNAKVPVMGLLAHMDTSPDAPGEGVVPRIFENYDGGDIVLSAETVISPREFPALANYAGQTIITASGNTLLGADDKAGIAEILTAMEYLLQHPEIPHGKIRVAFTPDEEIGLGTENFDVAAFGADFAFTVDGGATGELEYENFNAASATFEITGKSIHTGYAKGIMINSLLIAAELAMAFPPDETPSATEGYEGFYHLAGIEGDVGYTKMYLLIRSFDKEEFEARKKFAADLADSVNEKYGANTVKLEISDQYYDMKEKIDPWIIEYAKSAYAGAGVEPIIIPVRGGTDGAMLSYKGLPCPNIFAGEHNFHGMYEFVPLESMEKAVHVIINLCKAE